MPRFWIAFENSYTPALADRLEIINNVPGAAITGQFAQGTSMSVSGIPLTINYAGGTGNDVVLRLTTPPLPVANTDLATLPENSLATAINVLANDSGTGLHITAVTQGGNGTVAITGSGIGLTYQPTNLFIGADTFTYTVTDVVGHTATGTVVVIVTAVNQPPVVTVPGGPMEFVANQNLQILGISAADPQVYEGNGMVQATLSVQNGTLTLGDTLGLTFSQGNGTANSSMVFTGVLAVVNLALSMVTYHPNVDSAQPDTLTINVNNMGNFGSGGALSDTQTIALTPASGISSVPDPTLPHKQDLVIQGTTGNDSVTVSPSTVAGAYLISLNGAVTTVKGITGRILVFGLGGNDSITLASTVKLPALLDVGDGNDTVVGGAGNDTICQAGTGSNTINGGAGVNTLVESGDVDFTLVGGTATTNGTLTKGTAVDTLVLNHIQRVQLTLTGPDSHTIDGTKFAGRETFTGGTASDTLLAGSGSDILVGGSGNDKLVAGAGKDVLIAGGGADDLVGGAGQDLMIGGSTVYDNNVAALNAIMAEWASTAGYATRIKQLMGTQSGGLNGKTVLTSTTVLDNGKATTLTGGAGLDWFWTSALDNITNPNGKETNTPIS